MLSEHIITSIDEYEIRTRYPRFIGKNAKIPAHSYGHTLKIIEITTDKNVSGFGLGRKDRLTAQSLIGKRVSDVFDPAIGILDNSLFYADIALHDLAGKILGISVKKMISESAVDRVPVYDGAIYMDDISPDRFPAGIDGLVEHCKSDAARGYTDFKMKMGRQTWLGKPDGLVRDIEVVRAVRKAFPNARLLVDANDCYTLEEAIEFMEGIKDLGIYWVEELFHENREDLIKFKKYLDENSPETIIADGEWAPNYIHTASTLALVDELASEGLIDAVLMDTFDYGFTNWRKYIKNPNRASRLVSPHNWNNGLKTIYCSHLEAAYPDVIPTIEGVPDEIEGIDTSAYVMEDGLMTVPDAPGFGMQFIWGRKTS